MLRIWIDNMRMEAKDHPVFQPSWVRTDDWRMLWDFETYAVSPPDANSVPSGLYEFMDGFGDVRTCGPGRK